MDEEKIRSELSETLNRKMKEDGQKLLETKVGEDNTENFIKSRLKLLETNVGEDNMENLLCHA